MDFVGHGELFAAFGAAGCQDAAAIGRLHTLAEAVLVVALAVVGLECSFHCCGCCLFEEVLNGFVGYHLFVEDVGSGLGAFHHLNDFRVAAAIGFARLQGSHCFLCHSLLLL